MPRLVALIDDEKKICEKNLVWLSLSRYGRDIRVRKFTRLKPERSLEALAGWADLALIIDGRKRTYEAAQRFRSRFVAAGARNDGQGIHYALIEEHQVGNKTASLYVRKGPGTVH